jgi:hypothetical protein
VHLDEHGSVGQFDALRAANVEVRLASALGVGDVAQHFDVVRLEVEGAGDGPAGEPQVEGSGQVEVVEIAVADALAQCLVELGARTACSGDRVAQQSCSGCSGNESDAGCPASPNGQLGGGVDQ